MKIGDIYSVEELKERLSCIYPNTITKKTNERRQYNINSFRDLILNEIEQNNLQFGVKEERILLFTTKVGEKIYFQFPGKETTEQDQNGRVKHTFDSRPKIQKEDGSWVKDFTFRELWKVVENFNTRHRDLIDPLSCLYFRQGRMTIHEKTSRTYKVEIIENNEIIEDKELFLDWYCLDFEESLINTFLYHGKSVEVDSETEISLESFIYFFELLITNEDNKYWYKKGNLSSGRIPTTESMLLLSQTLKGEMKISELLQRFISGFGVPSCSSYEIPSTTGNLVKIINPKEELISIIEENGFLVKKSGSINIDRVSYKYLIKCDDLKIIVPKDNSEEDIFKNRGWTTILLQDDELFSKEDTFKVEQIIEETKNLNPSLI